MVPQFESVLVITPDELVNQLVINASYHEPENMNNLYRLDVFHKP